MTQVAADALGVPLERVRFELGDTALPKAPVSGGSQTAASVGAGGAGGCTRCTRARSCSSRSQDTQSPLYGASADDVRVENGDAATRVEADQGASRTAR